MITPATARAQEPTLCMEPRPQMIVSLERLMIGLFLSGRTSVLSVALSPHLKWRTAASVYSDDLSLSSASSRFMLAVRISLQRFMSRSAVMSSKVHLNTHTFFKTTHLHIFTTVQQTTNYRKIILKSTFSVILTTSGSHAENRQSRADVMMYVSCVFS